MGENIKILEVKNLTKRYPSFSVEDVSFSVPQGKIVGVIGRNGAGKSTVLKCITGLDYADFGEIRVFGEKRGKGAEWKERVGAVFGGIDFYPYKKLSVLSKAYSRFYSRWNADTYEKLCVRFGLDGGKRFRDLSNGMKVKFLLALACSHEAELFVFDEPTSGLDPVSRAEVLVLMRSLVKNGRRSVLFSTQITSDIEKCADEIVYIRKGKIARAAPKEEFLRSYAGENGEPLSLEEIMIKEEGVHEEFNY